MLCARAARTAVRSRGFALMSPPPRRAETVISLMSFVKIFPRLASLAAFLCLMVLHLEWPDIERLRRAGGASAPSSGRARGLSHAPLPDNRSVHLLTRTRVRPIGAAMRRSWAVLL